MMTPDNAALQAKLDKAVEALEEIRDLKERPYSGPRLDKKAIVDCKDCQKYEGHPIQRGICDLHRKPLYARSDHEIHEQQALGPRRSLIARDALHCLKDLTND